MNKKILKIVTTTVVIILLFTLSFILGIFMLNKSEGDIQENLNIENNINNEINNETEDEKAIDRKENKDFFEGKIIEIRGKDLIVENPEHLVDYSIYESDTRWHYNHQVVIDGKLYLTAGYMIETNNIIIKNSNGDKISISDLKEGDSVKVYTKNVEYTINTIFTPLTYENIELIEKKDN